MAVEKLVRVSCDRCSKMIDESELSSSEGGADSAPLIFAEFAGLDDELPSRISFEDLCSRCKKRCIDLVRNLAMISSKTSEKDGKEETPTEEEEVEFSPAPSPPSRRSGSRARPS